MPRATARHILLKTQAQAQDLKDQIDAGGDFAALAQKYSLCPSGQAGGSLGTFSAGDMVPEFDRIVFSDLPVGQTSEPVQTEFGYHLIQVQNRMG